MKDITKKYTSNDITIVWKPALCAHSTKCWQGEDGLLSVFNPAQKPWIKPKSANTQLIITQITQCPNGALSYLVYK